jgi:adenosylmethionine-8-amino-7-oxononanoate aminotransferase
VGVEEAGIFLQEAVEALVSCHADRSRTFVKPLRACPQTQWLGTLGGMGLICRPMPDSDVLAFSPSLIADEGDVDRICEILDEAISAVCGAED